MRKASARGGKYFDTMRSRLAEHGEYHKHRAGGAYGALSGPQYVVIYGVAFNKILRAARVRTAFKRLGIDSTVVAQQDLGTGHTMAGAKGYVLEVEGMTWLAPLVNAARRVSLVARVLQEFSREHIEATYAVGGDRALRSLVFNTPDKKPGPPSARIGAYVVQVAPHGIRYIAQVHPLEEAD